MKKLFVVLAAAFATAALAATPAFAGSTTWDGNGLSEGEVCTEGAHWILSPGAGIDSASLNVNGEIVTMAKNGQPGGNGSLTANTSGQVDENTSAVATWPDAEDSDAFLKVSDCFGSQTTTTTTGGPTTTTEGPTTTTEGPTTTTTTTTTEGPTTTTTEGPTTTTTEGPSTTTEGPTSGTTGGTTGGGGGGGAGGAGGAGGGETGELPFTGLPIWVPLLAAAGLLASGLMLIRRRKGELS